jgi:isopentenyl-diphosphate Delta-isomerase
MSGTASDPDGSDEMVVLLDERLTACGHMPKSLVHSERTPLHLAFSCYVFDDRGRVLVTRRALSKQAWPGVWTNSFCGHPAPGEEFDESVARRGQQELRTHIGDMRIWARVQIPRLAASGHPRGTL